MHISYEGGILEDPWRAPDDDMFIWTRVPAGGARSARRGARSVSRRASRSSLDGERLGPFALLDRLNKIAGAHGVGRVDLVENRFVGMKSRGVYETPGGTVLHAAHRAVESLTLDREVMHERDRLSPRFAELIYNGYWYAPEMRLPARRDRPVAGERDGRGAREALQGLGDA